MLGWSDVDIKANREFLRKDKELEWELNSIVNSGPNWRDNMQTMPQEGGPEAMGGQPGMPPGPGGAPGEIPDFSGGPAEVAPAGGEAAPAPGGEAPAAQPTA